MPLSPPFVKAPLAVVAGLLAALVACDRRHPSATDTPSQDVLRAAARFYDAYSEDARAHRREKLAQYYAPNGALIVLAGQRRFYSRAAIDSFYRGPWQGPAYFAWDTLAFDTLSSNLVLVTGRFRWLAAGARDTTRFIYAAILQTADSSLAIRVEQETPAPNRQR